ncbi:unnamed protein product [Brugia pahangi]|uniref:Anoctamin n=1 Tax=Brugia pahangi TaxID=6280 RepID=A0A0N4TQ60_BRUPA|nr:unnamed protein product [Brugia pahangi]
MAKRVRTKSIGQYNCVVTIVIMNKTISKLLQQEEPDQVHVVIFKYNSTSSSYLQQCSKWDFLLFHVIINLIAFIVYSRPISKETNCSRIVPQVVHHQNSTSVFALLLFISNKECFANVRYLHILSELDVEKNKQNKICQLMHICSIFIANEAVIWEDKRESVTANQFFAEQINHRFIRAITEVKRYKEKGFYRDLRYYLKWVSYWFVIPCIIIVYISVSRNEFYEFEKIDESLSKIVQVYLCMGALTTIAFAATVSTLIAEFHFQRQHYLAKNKPVKLIINRELLNQVRLAKRALHPIGIHFLVAIIEK